MFYRGVHLIEVSIKRESTVYMIQVVASVGKMTLQINSGLLRTVKKLRYGDGDYYSSTSEV